MANSSDQYEEYLKSCRDEYRNRYGEVVDKVLNPQLLKNIENTTYDPLKVFELLFQVYNDLEKKYKCSFNITILHTSKDKASISLDIGGSHTSISIEDDQLDGNTYIVLYDFYLPKDKIKAINRIKKNKSYTHNGYRIVKTLEVICKCWEFSGMKVNHIINEKLAQTLLSEGYENIYKLKGYRSWDRLDYIKKIPTNMEVSGNYKVEQHKENRKSLIEKLIGKYYFKYK